jgi:ATP-binding cassette subfamily F protein 3
MQTIDALIRACQNFTGGVMVISHDEHFIKSVCNEIWLIANRSVKTFNGSFDDYKQMVLSKK